MWKNKKYLDFLQKKYRRSLFSYLIGAPKVIPLAKHKCNDKFNF